MAVPFLSSLRHVAYQGLAALAENPESVQIRQRYETRFKKLAMDARSVSITILAVGVIVSLATLLIAPVTALILFSFTYGAAYSVDVFARYFDKAKEICQDAGNFVTSRNQSREDFLLNLFAEKATKDLPFFVRPVVEYCIKNVDGRDLSRALNV